MLNVKTWAASATVTEMVAPARKTATANGTGVDFILGSGKALFTLATSAGGGTAPTLDVKLQSSATQGGTYADITGAVFTQVTNAADATETITVDLDGIANRWIRAVITISGTSPTFDLSLTGLWFKAVTV